MRDLLLRRSFSPDISLLRNGKLGTLALGQRYPGLDAFSDDENIGDTARKHKLVKVKNNRVHIPRSECSVKGVFDMDNIKTSDMLLSVHNETRPTHVAPASDYNDVSSVKFDEVSDLALLEIIFDSIIGFNSRIGITNRASVVGDNVGNAAGTNSYSADFQELVGGFFRCDAVDGETAFDIVEESEVLSRFFDRNDI